MNFRIKGVLAAVMLGLATGADAQLAWEKTEIELRPKPGDEEAVAQFKYTNKGDKPIRITNVKSSCGCTVPALKKNEVAPGESGEITATFKIGGRTGTQVKSVRVDTDDPSQPSANLILKAVIPQGVQVQPTFVFWQTGEEVKPKTITVRAGEGSPLNEVDVTSSSPDFTTKVEKRAAGEFADPRAAEEHRCAAFRDPDDQSRRAEAVSRARARHRAGLGRGSLGKCVPRCGRRCCCWASRSSPPSGRRSTIAPPRRGASPRSRKARYAWSRRATGGIP